MNASARPRARGALLVPLVLAVLLLAASCADDPAPDTSPPPAPDRVPTAAPEPAPEPPPERPVPAPDPLTAQPPPGGTALPADRVDAAGLPPGFPTMVWTRDARTLGVYGRAGGCTEASAEVVEQDATQVVVAVSQVTTGPGPCTRELIYPPLEVALDDDLGQRPVVLRGEMR